MKYKTLYPNLKPLVEANDPFANVIRGNGEKFPCHFCKTPCDYIDIDYEAYFCSQECTSSFEKSCGL